MNGRIYYINFSGNKGSEINKTHLGIIFSIPKVKNMVFCIPLTSPKIKRFKTQNLVYIDQTDSIALLDQMRSISIHRLLKPYNDITLNEKNINILTTKTIKYLKHILK